MQSNFDTCPLSTETDLLFYLAPRQFRKLVYDVCRHLATRARIVVKVMCQFFCHPVPYFQVFCSVVNPDPPSGALFSSILQCCQSGSGWSRNFSLDPELFVSNPDPGKNEKG